MGSKKPYFCVIPEHSGKHGHPEEDDHQMRGRVQPGQAVGDLQRVGRQNRGRILYSGYYSTAVMSGSE